MSDIFNPNNSNYIPRGRNYTKKIKLRMMMAKREMLVYNLAKKTETSSVQVSRILNGYSNGSVEWWQKAAKALDCDLSDILEAEVN